MDIKIPRARARLSPKHQKLIISVTNPRCKHHASGKKSANLVANCRRDSNHVPNLCVDLLISSLSIPTLSLSEAESIIACVCSSLQLPSVIED